MHFYSAFKCVLFCVFLDSGTVRLRRVREILAEEWDENNDIFSLTSRENSIKLTYGDLIEVNGKDSM